MKVSPTYAKEIGITEKVFGANAVMYHYIGASIGSLLFGYLSEFLLSRKKALYVSIISMALFIGLFFFPVSSTALSFYIIIGLLGVSMGGLWAVFMVNASEQFGTNVRATVTTTAPNFVRGTTVLVSIGIASLMNVYGLWAAGLIVGIICIVISFISIAGTEETYGKDLDYNE